MTEVEAAIANGYAAFQRGDLATARAILEPLQHHQAWHILGLVERAAKQYAKAVEWLERAEQRDPRNPEIANNKGRVLVDAGQPAAAEQSFRRALQLRPNWTVALSGLARSLNAQNRWHDAYPVWTELLKLTPDDKVARYNAAMAALETGHVAEADAEFDALIRGGLTDPAVYFMRGRTRLELSDLEGGLKDFQHSWRAQPTGHALRNLANTLWMTGDHSGFRETVESAPEAFSALKMYLLAKAGDELAALRVWETLSEPQKNDPETLTMKANIHKDRGEAGLALEAASNAHAQIAGQETVDDAMVAALLMNGDHAAALKIIETWRTKLPTQQAWLAHQLTALRLAGSPDYQSMLQPEKFIQAFELPVPDGFETIDEFNAALVAAIAPFQSFEQRPLDQTLRAGTQTARDLVHVEDPVIQAYLRALDGPIRAYLDAIGTDPAHPFLSRNTGKYRFNGCWSVTLTGGGRHVNHVHPKGWISSAYYARVPTETDDNDKKPGWIKFGEPPFETQPSVGPEKWIQPKPGTLVLFPSYMWHGTNAISDGAERITVPFDLVPA